MKRKIAEDGTRTHELTVPEKRALRKAQEVVEEVAYFHRDTAEGDAAEVVVRELDELHDGHSLSGPRVSDEDAPEDET